MIGRWSATRRCWNPGSRLRWVSWRRIIIRPLLRGHIAWRWRIARIGINWPVGRLLGIRRLGVLPLIGRCLWLLRLRRKTALRWLLRIRRRNSRWQRLETSALPQLLARRLLGRGCEFRHRR